MLPTPKEKERQQQVKRQKELAREFAAASAKQQQAAVNPLYGTDPFEPSAYLPTVPSDPKLSQPLPSGRYIDHNRFPTGTSIAKAAEIEEFRRNPDKYVQQNTQQLNNEQSLVEKGLSMMGRVFNYRDEADAQFFGVDLSAAESTWDNFLRYFTGAYDLLSIGFGGLISAAPGGVRTLSYDELSGGKSVGQVLQGEMEGGSAPSPGQIAITSVALEAKRIREGKARLSDVLLMNPATAPFILAALAADTSPLQQDGFNIMDAEQREQAFSSGYEQWMSGVTDAGLMFADPLIGVGVAGKVARLGALGIPGSAKYGNELKAGLDNAVDEVSPESARLLNEVEQIGISRQKASETPEGIAMRIAEDPTYDPTAYVQPVTFNVADPIPDYKNPLSNFLHRLHQVNDEGRRVMTPDEIARDPNFDGLTDKASIADLLYSSQNPAMSSLILQTVGGTPGALEKLARVDAGLADVAFRYRREYYSVKSIFTEPQKTKEVVDGLQKQIQDTKTSISVVDEQLRTLAPTPEDLGSVAAKQNLDIQRKTLQQNLDELEELYAVAADGKQVDFLDPTNPFYRQDRADEIMASIMTSPEVYRQLVDSSLVSAAKTARMFLPSKNNAYSRMVMDSRGRRRRARYEYAAEGTSIFPRKVVTETVDGKVVRQSDGWFSESQFGGTSRFRRNIRIWRWLGAEAPSGYIGLKGTATVGSEREFTAALNTDLYRSKPVTVERDVIDPKTGKPVVETLRGEDGKTITRIKREKFEVGGVAARQEYFRRFYAALNDPKIDAKQVLDDIERQVMKDYSDAYGLSTKFMESLWSSANKKREQNLTLLRERGYFVDPDSGDIQFVPYLDAQLANGTYMQNFFELEQILKREAAKDGMESLKAKMAIPAHMAGSAYNQFNNFWRPLTLMRLSYTQRNIFEGTLRAMAFSASLAPLSWPVKATAFGVRNKIVGAAVSKRAKQAAKRIESSEYGRYLREYNDAVVDEYYLKGALEIIEAADAEPMMAVVGRNREVRRLTREEYERELQTTVDRVSDAQAALKDNAQKFTESIKGTAFGKWRDKNISDLRQELQASENWRASLVEAQQDLLANGYGPSIDDATLRKYAEYVASESKLQMDLDALLYDPVKATSMYRTQAGRQKRIGSGKSMGPNGTKYDDAFTGPYDQINRALMSADNTVTQQLSLRADIWNSLFYKTMVRENTAVEFGPGTQKQWVKGMAEAIEEASSSWLIRSLVANGWDEAKVLQEMTSTDQGRVFLTRVLSLFGDQDMRKVAKTAEGEEPTKITDAYTSKTAIDAGAKAPVGQRAGVRRFAELQRTAAGAQEIRVTDIDQARIYINEVANQVKAQMQGRQEFMSLLQRRAQDKSRGAGAQGAAITDAEVEDALRLIPKDQQNLLGAIQGATIVRMGADGFLNMWATLTNKIFKYLGTIPEDAITRGGFYNMQFKAARNTLIEDYLIRSGQEGALRRGRSARNASNGEQGMTINHDEFSIPQNELNRIMYQAHRQALKDTREWMYTIERRTNLGKYGEWIFPFISATQNSATVAGKLLYKEPWLAPMIIDLWRMPSRLGVEDEEGNVLIPMPFEWVRKWAQDNPNIPIIGGVVDSADVLRIPKDGLNVFMPETGFGIAPRPTPWVQVGASELMKANMFPVETPQILRSALGTEAGDEFYKTFKDYVFGEEQGASATFASLDKIAPAYIQKIVQSRSELSAQYGYQYAIHMNTQLMRFRMGERDTAPTEDEIHKRTTNSMWFGVLGNQGVPTPLTPYPILTRPMVDNPITVLQDVYQKLQEADPLTANMNMDLLFGDWALEAANTKVSQNVGGANPTPETVSDIETLSPLIRQISPDLGPRDLSVLGILVNNRRAPAAYEQSAYNWQKAAQIPGTNREWREVQSPEEAVAERQRITGWTVFRQAIDQLDAQMKSAGITSYESKAGAPYKAAKDRLVQNMLSNPDFAGWIVDYQDRGGSKTQSAVRVLEAAVQDESFRNLLINSGKERLFGIMGEYVTNRRLLLTALEQSGHSIEHDSNVMLKIAWDSLRLKWRNEDERWAEIDSLYLSGDSNPQSPGNLGLMAEAESLMQGVG